MPTQYVKQRAELVKNGLTEEQAAEISSKEYATRHEIDLNNRYDLSVLDYLYEVLKSEGKLDKFPKVEEFFKYVKVK